MGSLLASTAPVLRPAIALLCTLVIAACLTGCGDSGPTEPGPPPDGPSGVCRALNYFGANGGERIQNAINDTSCRTISIDDAGPDGSGVWHVTRGLTLRSSIVIENRGASAAVLESIGGGTHPILIVEGQSDVTIRGLRLQGSLSSGIRIDGSHRITVVQGTVSGSVRVGIRITGSPSSDIAISQMAFQDNGGVDVRTDTTDWNAYHSHVVVTNNSMTGTLYGVALQNCGSSPATACEVRNNTIRSSPRLDGSGVDLNRSHHAIVSGNTISNGGHGMTVDDNQNAIISQNTIQGCLGYGIVLANGARPANKPWILSGNQILDNTVSDNKLFGLASYRIPTDPDNRNELNVWRNNRISGNIAGGCSTNADQNTFSGNGPQACSPQH